MTNQTVSHGKFRHYDSSSSSSESESDGSNDSNSVPVTASDVKKSPAFYVFQCRYAIRTQAADYSKLLKSLISLDTKLSNSPSRCKREVGLGIACLRLCNQIRNVMASDDYPIDRQLRRHLRSSDQAKASIILQQKGDQLLTTIERRFTGLRIPQEFFAPDATETLNNLEKYLLAEGSPPIPIEILNTFQLVCIRKSLWIYAQSSSNHTAIEAVLSLYRATERKIFLKSESTGKLMNLTAERLQNNYKAKYEELKNQRVMRSLTSICSIALVGSMYNVRIGVDLATLAVDCSKLPPHLRQGLVEFAFRLRNM